MSSMRKLFRPGKDSTVARYTAAFINGATVYPGDLVKWDITAPASQGASGVVEGKTLGTTDFIFAILPAANTPCRQAGIVMGPSIQRDSGATAIVNDTVAHIQTYGVCGDIFAVTSTDSAAGVVLHGAATSGAVTQLLPTDAVLATAVTDLEVVGFALTAQATDHVRGTATTEPGLDAFIRCDF